jgi:hypothetical protein
VRREAPINLEADHLAFRVRAGVGAPSRVDLVLGARELTQRPLQLGFDSAAMRLLLPAGKAAPVVLKHDFHIHFLNLSLSPSGERAASWQPAPVNRRVR